MCRGLWERKLRGIQMKSLSRRFCPGLRGLADAEQVGGSAAYSEYYGSLDDTSDGLGRRFEGTLNVLHSGDVSLDKINLRAQSRNIF